MRIDRVSPVKRIAESDWGCLLVAVSINNDLLLAMVATVVRGSWTSNPLTSPFQLSLKFLKQLLRQCVRLMWGVELFSSALDLKSWPCRASCFNIYIHSSVARSTQTSRKCWTSLYRRQGGFSCLFFVSCRSVDIVEWKSSTTNRCPGHWMANSLKAQSLCMLEEVRRSARRAESQRSVYPITFNSLFQAAIFTRLQTHR